MWPQAEIDYPREYPGPVREQRQHGLDALYGLRGTVRGGQAQRRHSSDDRPRAALDIALNPGNNVSGLFGLSSANAAFQPALTVAPNDWTIALAYDVASANHPQGLAIDGAETFGLPRGLAITRPALRSP